MINNVSLIYVFGFRKKLLGFKCIIEMYNYFFLRMEKKEFVKLL